MVPIAYAGIDGEGTARIRQIIHPGITSQRKSSIETRIPQEGAVVSPHVVSGKVVGSDLDGSVAVESNSASGSVHIRDSPRFQAASARLELSVVLYASAFETNRTSGSAPASAVVGVVSPPLTVILEPVFSFKARFHERSAQWPAAGSGGSVLSAASTGTAQQIGYEIVSVSIPVLAQLCVRA